MMKKRVGRKRKGFVLLSVMMIGLFAVMFLFAVASALISMLQSETAIRQKANLLNAAIIGRNYALQKINKAPDAPVIGHMELPPALCPNNDVVVTMYVSSLDDEISEQICNRCGLTSNDAKYYQIKSTLLINVTATRGIFSKKIQSLATRGTTSTDGVTQPLFLSGGLATTSLVASPLTSDGKLRIESLNIGATQPEIDSIQNQIATSNGNTFKLTLNSNGTAILGGDTTLLGNISAAKRGGAQATGESWILGRVTTTGSSDQSIRATNGAMPSVTDNVWAAADWAKSYSSPTLPQRSALVPDSVQRTAPNDVPSVSTPVSPSVPSPTPSAPENSRNLYTTINELGSLVFEHPQDGQEEISSFTASELLTSNDDFSAIKISSENQKATKVYVNNEDSAEPVVLDANKLQNPTGDPRNLQLYYNGSGRVSLTLSESQEFNGLIYAPNAQLSIEGKGNFNGAFYGKDVRIRADGILRLVSPADLSLAANDTRDIVPTFNGKATSFTGYIATTYKEV